jgi:hypothetical protein
VELVANETLLRQSTSSVGPKTNTNMKANVTIISDFFFLTKDY